MKTATARDDHRHHGVPWHQTACEGMTQSPQSFIAAHYETHGLRAIPLQLTTDHRGDLKVARRARVPGIDARFERVRRNGTQRPRVALLGITQYHARAND